MAWRSARVIISTKINYTTPLFQMVVGAGRDGSTDMPFMGPPQRPAGLLAGRCLRICLVMTMN
jgi:hypothetical protein